MTSRTLISLIYGRFFLILLCLAFVSCPKPLKERNVSVNGNNIQNNTGTQSQGTSEKSGDDFLDKLAQALARARLPQEQAEVIKNAARESPSFILDLLSIMSTDPYLRALVDKQHSLPGGYEPDDLEELSSTQSYRLNRQELLLRKAAAEALEEMALAARTAGITLLVSSCYRSYQYQEEVYARNVRQLGQAQADRESARPGHSQHQLGLAIDFGSIDDSFAETAAGRWLLVNASRFGFSLSFPKDYEEITGYRWESWHYRYVGHDLARFIDDYFGGIQQYALQFLQAWQEINISN